MNKKNKLIGVAALGACLVLFGYGAYAASEVGSEPTFEVDTSLPYGPELTGGFTISPPQVDPGQPVEFSAGVYDQSGVKSVYVDIVSPATDTTLKSIELLDDGSNDDGTAGNNVFGRGWDTSGMSVGVYTVRLRMADKLDNLNTQDAGYIALGEGGCLHDDECTSPERCCYGVCVSNACSTDADCDDADDATLDRCNTVDVCPAYCSNNVLPCVGGDGVCPPGCGEDAWECVGGDYNGIACDPADSESCGGPSSGSVCTLIEADSDCTVDTTAPVVSVQTPGDSETIDGNTYTEYEVTVTASDPESNIAQVRFLLDGTEQSVWLGDPAPGTGLYTWIMPVGPLTEGAHTIIAEAENGIGTLSEDGVSFIYTAPTSSVAPTVSITAPANGATVTGSTTVDVTATDDGLVNEVSFYHCVVGLQDSDSSFTPASTVNVTLNSWNATSTATALLENYIMPFAALQQDVKKFKLPFVPVAHAADDSNCTTTTTTRNYTQCIYAMAIDDDSLVGTSAYVYVTTPITTTTTSCTTTNRMDTPSSASSSSAI
ncbi:MAG: Ig-like domain-containing protein [Patescibacteria group bacterium]